VASKTLAKTYPLITAKFRYTETGQTTRIDGRAFQVVGVGKALGTVFGQPRDMYVSMPLSTFLAFYGSRRSLSVSVTSTSEKTYQDAIDEARLVMRIRRKLAPGEKDNFGIVTPSAINELRDKIFGTIQIGVRKAIGARRRDIIVQFLIEAGTLTGVGGVLGIVLGAALPLLIQRFMPTYLPLWAPVVGFGVSVALGLIFGLWPAWKAARLNPIEALRYE